MNANYKLILAAIITIFAAGFLNPAFASTDSVTESGAEQPSSSSDSDTLNYQADLFTGRFTYSIPIKVAPGRQGSEPKLALNYSSAVGNGWCGVGWTLEAGYIQRDTRRGVPLLFGPTNSLGIYDDSKGFFGGVSVKGDSINPDTDANLTYYGDSFTMKQIVSGEKAKPTPVVNDLIKKLNDYAKVKKEK